MPQLPIRPLLHCAYFPWDPSSQAREKETGKLVALKRIKMEKEKDGFPVTSIREINVLLNFHHPNLVHVSEIVISYK